MGGDLHAAVAPWSSLSRTVFILLLFQHPSSEPSLGRSGDLLATDQREGPRRQLGLAVVEQISKYPSVPASPCSAHGRSPANCKLTGSSHPAQPPTWRRPSAATGDPLGSCTRSHTLRHWHPLTMANSVPAALESRVTRRDVSGKSVIQRKERGDWETSVGLRCTGVGPRPAEDIAGDQESTRHSPRDLPVPPELTQGKRRDWTGTGPAAADIPQG
ncbi:hypothetical protein CB1_000977007 [Camelus ferus]|nr:hypothetical protein CB1_000977007 [Camelus ferus]